MRTVVVDNRGRNAFFAVIGIILGMAVLFSGVTQYTGTSVMCGHQVQHRGDTCVETSNGKETVRTYAQQKDSNRATAVLTLILGAAAIVGAVIFLGFQFRAPRERVVPDAPYGWAPPQQFPPPTPTHRPQAQAPDAAE